MSARRRLALCLSLLALCLAFFAPSAAQAAFGIKSLSAIAENEDGSVDLAAGSHPYQFTLDMEMNLDAEGKTEGTLRELIVDLPAGMVGNPEAVERCPGALFEGQLPHCPGNSQIGVATIRLQGGEIQAGTPVYNLTPPQGSRQASALRSPMPTASRKARCAQATTACASLTSRSPPTLKSNRSPRRSGGCRRPQATTTSASAFPPKAAR